jgi:hypothetical protein
VVLVVTGAVAAVTVGADVVAARADDAGVTPVVVDVVVEVVDVAPAVPGEVRTTAPRTPVTSSVDGIAHRRVAGSTNKAPLDADRVS